MDVNIIGKLLVIAGATLVLLGILLLIAARSGWLGGLLQSGVLRLQGGGVTCLVPVVASILLSVILTLVLNLVIRLLNK